MGWGNPPSRGRKIKHVYIPSHSPGVLGWGFLRFFVGLAIKEFEQGRPKLTSRERRKINSRTHIYLFMKASRVVLRGVRLREEPLTSYVIRNSLGNEIWPIYNAKYSEMRTFYTPFVSVAVSGRPLIKKKTISVWNDMLLSPITAFGFVSRTNQIAAQGFISHTNDITAFGYLAPITAFSHSHQSQRFLVPIISQLSCKWCHVKSGGCAQRMTKTITFRLILTSVMVCGLREGLVD